MLTTKRKLKRKPYVINERCRARAGSDTKYPEGGKYESGLPPQKRKVTNRETQKEHERRGKRERQNRNIYTGTRQKVCSNMLVTGRIRRLPCGSVRQAKVVVMPWRDPAAKVALRNLDGARERRRSLANCNKPAKG